MNITQFGSDARLSSRRRAIRLVAAGSAVGLAAAIGVISGRSSNPGVSLHRWQGAALGADASILIGLPDARRAERLISLALAEIDRLERIFSLYRRDSALVRLNEEGRLRNPPPELVSLLDRARQWSEISGGAFDVTVQPLWQLYRDHFSKPDANPLGPSEAAVATARALVDFRAVDVSTKRIAFARPGMMATLNGIAQGDITDRVADLLRAEGLRHALVDLGELRALSSHVSGRPWKVGVKNPNRVNSLLSKVELTDRALATSATTGTRFDPNGRHHHLFDPNSGRPSRGLVAASVIARRALDADALSTALLAAPEALAPESVAHMGVERVLSVTAEGELREWRA